MSRPLLTTKLYVPPSRPNLVPRPRLSKQLDDGLHLGHRLTLVSAPAGFGKTTLLSDWVARHAGPIAWLSLDEQDNEPGRFWSYLIAALQSVHPGLGQESQQALQAAPLPTAPAILNPLLNEIDALAGTAPARDLILVLDDYHLISVPPIHEGIAFLLEHQPANAHLVISTRADPPLPLARLRARAHLTELRSGDLRFTPGEAALFLNTVMGLDLTPADTEALEARTEGWIVGLQLAALSLQGRADPREFIAAFSGSHHYVLEYLTEEVLARQSEPVRQFLLQTSFLDRLCGPLCDHVMGVEQATTAERPGPPVAGPGQEMLKRLDQANLFVVPLDDQRHWYRYHHLFADLLTKQLGQQMAPQQVAKLQGRASAWHEDHGSLDEAVAYAFKAEDYPRVVRLVEGAALAGRLESRLSTMLHWLERVPEEMLLPRPRLRIYQAWALVINERLDLAQQVLRESSAALAALPSFDGDAARRELDALLEIVEMMAAALAAAYSGENIEEAFQAALAARERALAAGNVFLAGHATNGLAMARFHQGRLVEAAEYYHQLVDLGTGGAPSQLALAVVGRVGLAAICLERDELDAAAQHLDHERLGRYRVGTNTLVSAAVTRSRLRQIGGDREGAWQALDEVEHLGHVRDSAPALHRLARQRAWLKLAEGDLDAADHLIRHLGNAFGHAPAGRELPAPFREAQEILAARLHLCRGQAGLALTRLDQIEPAASAAGRFGRILEISLLKALALQARGRTAAALGELARSLELAEPEGYVRIYLDEGAPLAALLERLRRTQRVSLSVRTYAERLLGALAAGSRPPVAAGPAEALTRREWEVLRLMASGRSGPEIAQELVVAYSTVKSHTKNLYGKLGAHSRHEAIERAKALNLI